MRIAQICPYDIDRPGGVQIHIRDTAAALAKLGHEVVIIAPRIAGRSPAGALAADPRVEIVRLGTARKIGFGGTNYEISIALGGEKRKLAAAMRAGFDVVHYHTIWTPLLPLQIFFRSRSANVATFHDTPASTFAGKCLAALFRMLSRILLPRLDEIIAVSDAPLRHLSAASGQRIRILPPCTDLRRFAAPAAPAATHHRDGKLQILFLGRLDRRKGAMILLEAYRRLAADGLPVRLAIAGSGEEAPRLQQKVLEHGLADVAFTGEFESGQSPRLFGECDIFCAPSLYGESFGIVVAEAMASGKPVVAAANAGYRNLLTGAGARFLVPPGDADALYGALRVLVLDPELRREMGAWGRAAALAYDCHEVAPQLVAVYREAIAKAKARAGASRAGAAAAAKPARAE